jgi:hypothetical protein
MKTADIKLEGSINGHKDLIICLFKAEVEFDLPLDPGVKDICGIEKIYNPNTGKPSLDKRILQAIAAGTLAIKRWSAYGIEVEL